MDTNEINANDSVSESRDSIPPVDPSSRLRHSVLPQQTADCPTCSSGDSSTADRSNGPLGYVYAVGQIGVRFPSISVEKEFAQAAGREDTKGLTDRQALQKIMSARSNRYLARQVCWVLSIEGLETYILAPRDPLDYEALVEAIRPTPRRTDVDVVVGVRGPVAPAEACNGLALPIVGFDLIYSFDTDSFITAIADSLRAAPESDQEGGAEGGEGPAPRKRRRGAEENAGEGGADVRASAEEIFNRIVQVADNAGSTDEHRALNYLATRYPDTYRLASERFGANYSLVEVSVQPSRLSGTRKIVTVVFTFGPRTGGGVVGLGAEQYFVRVDVTDEFPFLVSPLQRGFIR